MALRQLIYTSELSVPIHKLESELRRIIEVAERKNPQAGITGCLMVSGSRVVQFWKVLQMLSTICTKRSNAINATRPLCSCTEMMRWSEKRLSGRCVYVVSTQQLNPWAT